MYACLRKGYCDAIAGHESALRLFMDSMPDEFYMLDESLYESELGVAFEKGTHEELAEEIVSSAVVKFSKRFPDIKVEVDIPEEVVIVPMDPILIRQVIVNIMENAVIHGGSTTQVKVAISANETEAIFSIEDNGKGIDGKILPMLFTGQISHREGETYDNKRSMGIGLSVCKSIIDAHRGKVWAENKIDGGAKISFTLPLEEEEQNGD